MNCWEAWNLSKKYQVMPSELYCIRDELAGWCFNRAIYLFGSSLEAALVTAENRSRNPRQAQFRRSEVLKKWLGVEMKFRDPAPEVKKNKSSKDVDSTMSGHVTL